MSETRYIAFVVAYDGTAFSGSQRQSVARSVQGELERVLEQVLKHPARVQLAGRTDAGVHATGQCGRFATTNRIPVQRVPAALNRLLDKAVRVLSAREVEERFHPRFSARGRVYRYSIDNGAVPNPLLWRYAGHVIGRLDVSAMKRAAEAFVGCHDFAAWQSAGSPNGATLRTVRRLEVRGRRDVLTSRLIEIEIEADAFLYQMVRNIVGALLKAGHGEIDRAEIERLMAGRDRTRCPPPAPPQGLCLVQVKY